MSGSLKVSQAEPSPYNFLFHAAGHTGYLQILTLQ